MTVTTLHNGAISITQIVNNQLLQRSYYGYSKKEARSLFRDLVNQTKKEVTN